MEACISNTVLRGWLTSCDTHLLLIRPRPKDSCGWLRAGPVFPLTADASHGIARCRAAVDEPAGRRY